MYLSDSPTFLGHLIDSHIIKNGGIYSEWEIGITDNPDQIKVECPECGIFETANRGVAIATQEFLMIYRNIKGFLAPTTTESRFIFVRKKKVNSSDISP